MLGAYKVYKKIRVEIYTHIYTYVCVYVCVCIDCLYIYKNAYKTQ